MKPWKLNFCKHNILNSRRLFTRVPSAPRVLSNSGSGPAGVLDIPELHSGLWGAQPASWTLPHRQLLIGLETDQSEEFVEAAASMKPMFQKCCVGPTCWSTNWVCRRTARWSLQFWHFSPSSRLWTSPSLWPSTFAATTTPATIAATTPSFHYLSYINNLLKSSLIKLSVLKLPIKSQINYNNWFSETQSRFTLFDCFFISICKLCNVW